MARAKLKYQRWLEAMEANDPTKENIYCIIEETHWGEEHGLVIKHDQLVWSEQDCEKIEYSIWAFGKTKAKIDDLWETFGCNGHFSEPVRYYHKGTYQELKEMLKQATLDEDRVQKFH